VWSFLLSNPVKRYSQTSKIKYVTASSSSDKRQLSTKRAREVFCFRMTNQNAEQESPEAEQPDWDSLRLRLEKLTGKKPATPPNVIPAQQGDVANNKEVVEFWNGPFRPGMVLVANPQFYYADQTPDFHLLKKFGFESSLPKEIQPDRQADLLPCVLIVDTGAQGSYGFVLNRRTGYLAGDLGKDNGFEAFMIQPIWFGGTSGAQGLGFIHSYSDIPKSNQLTDDGLFYGGDLPFASEKVLNGSGTGFNFRFFLQFTKWEPKELEQQVIDGKWLPVKCSKMVILKARDRVGPYKCPPMWTDILKRLGRPYTKLLDYVYH